MLSLITAKFLSLTLYGSFIGVSSVRKCKFKFNYVVCNDEIHLNVNKLPIEGVTAFPHYDSFLAYDDNWRLRCVWDSDYYDISNIICTYNYVGDVNNFAIKCNKETIIEILDDLNSFRLNDYMKRKNSCIIPEDIFGTRVVITDSISDEVRREFSRLNVIGARIWDRCRTDLGKTVTMYFENSPVSVANMLITDCCVYLCALASLLPSHHYGTKLFQWVINFAAINNCALGWVSTASSESFYRKFGLQKYKIQSEDNVEAMFLIPVKDIKNLNII